MATTTGKLVKIEVQTIDGQWENVVVGVDPAGPEGDETGVAVLVDGDFAHIEGRVISWLVDHYGLSAEQAAHIICMQPNANYRVSTPAMIDIDDIEGGNRRSAEMLPWSEPIPTDGTDIYHKQHAPDKRPAWLREQQAKSKGKTGRSAVWAHVKTRLCK